MSKTYYDTPLWDSSLSIEERLDYLLSEMTLEEKIQSMGTGNPEIERPGVPAFQVGGEAAHGVQARHDQEFDVHEPDLTTIFQNPIGMSASFDEELMRKQWHSIAVNENEILKAYGEDNGIMIGTTLTAMLMFRDSYYIIHVGDSRAYEITGTEARQLTNDQTFVAREVAAGRMTPEQAEVDSRRSVLLQCIGASPVVEPDFIKGEVVGDAVYMLCSDGFRRKISNEEMIERIGPAADVDDDALTTGCQFLTELDKYRKETDNITVLCIRTTP